MKHARYHEALTPRLKKKKKKKKKKGEEERRRGEKKRRKKGGGEEKEFRLYSNDFGFICIFNVGGITIKF